MEKRIRVALAGNANVGKSVIFNQLTGLHQHIGNWPGKTVEKAEGELHFKGYTIEIIDLPGIYSLSTFSLEELISREYIINERPDVVINVVDASVLERNLFFTLQLMELEIPLIIALNQVDVAERKGIKIDYRRLEEILGVPTVPTIAIRGKGIHELLFKVIEGFEKGFRKPAPIKYGSEIETRIKMLEEALRGAGLRYPLRWAAIKILEGDEEVIKEVRRVRPEALTLAEKMAKEIEEIHGHPCPTVITSERYEVAGKIAREVQRILPTIKLPLSDKIDYLTTHKVYGYIIMAITILVTFYAVFGLGNFLSEVLTNVLYGYETIFVGILGSGLLRDLIWGGVIEGVIATITIALPYIVPFYLILYALEDSGYLARIAFLMDAFMHKIGLHGKAFIPLILGYGCNVPACLGCRIMETERERLIAGFLSTLIPCAARSVVILGLVGKYLGVEWALYLYVVDLAIVFIFGRIAFKVLPGEAMALIMEMPDYKTPHLKTVIKQTLFRLEEFLKIAFPVIVISGLIIKAMDLLNVLYIVSKIMSPVTVVWLGLPEILGVLLILGVLRKELTLILLATLLGSQNLHEHLTPLQMLTFSLIVMLYVPCVATIATCIKEFGWKKAMLIAVIEVFFAILLGGLFYRALMALEIFR
ncbi:MAG: ferrous iron transport protein B [Candidatus Bathyarchaeia archaeon]|nr:ferrous iron transport protein B [Candidatus Bathyarchaeota archaeon]